jgi:hypothetical protein
MADKRVFTLEIDGVKRVYDEVSLLCDILLKCEDIMKKLTVETGNAARSTANGTIWIYDKVLNNKTLSEANKVKAEFDDLVKY